MGQALRERLADSEKRISGEQVVSGEGAGANPAVAFLRKELIRSRVEADAKVGASKPVSNRNLCLSNNLVVQIFWVVR